MNILLKNALVLTETGLIPDCSIFVENKVILRITKYITGLTPDRTIDCSGMVLAPGFINTHNHMYGVLSHGINANAVVTEFSSFLEAFWWPYVENRVDHEAVRTTTLWACAEAIESGVTCFADILEAPSALPGALEAEREIIEQTGLRAYLSFEACQRMTPENGRLGLEENASFCRAHNRHDNLVQGFMSIHTLFTCDRDFCLKAKDMARQSGAFTHMHLCESIFEPTWAAKHLGMSPVEAYAKWGFLGPDVLASQAVQMSHSDRNLLAAHKVRLAHMPLSNGEVGGGVAPFPDFLAAGMTCGLGTDGYVNSMFEVMRGAFLMHKAYRHDPTIMPAKSVYDMATRLGAKALGRGDLGVLREGAKADIIAIDANTPTPMNDHNIYEQLVLFRSPEHVRHVMVNGSLLKENGSLTTIDKAKALASMRAVTERFWKF